MLSKIGGRKFIVAVVAMAIAVLVDVLSDKGLSESLRNMLLAITALFFTGNQISKALEKKGIVEHPQGDIELPDSHPTMVYVPPVESTQNVDIISEKIDNLTQLVASNAEVQNNALTAIYRELNKE
jgi:hypothetical protein